MSLIVIHTLFIICVCMEMELAYDVMTLSGRHCRRSPSTASTSLIGIEVTHEFFVRVEVLRPSQPNGAMSSVVSLPNHMFTGQA